MYSAVPSAEMFQKIISGPSGTALLGLFVLFAVASEAIVRAGRRRHALIYAAGKYTDVSLAA